MKPSQIYGLLTAALLGSASLTSICLAEPPEGRPEGRPDHPPFHHREHGREGRESREGREGHDGPGHHGHASASPVAKRALAELLFERIDRNHNGEITRDEFSAFWVMGGPPAPMAGRVQQGEMHFPEGMVFGNLAADTADPDARPRPEGQEGRPKRGPGDGQQAGAKSKKDGEGRKKGPPNAEMMFKRLDANGDGKLVADEVPERMKERFDKMDSNGDGAITLEELKTVFEKRAQKGKGGPDGKGGPEGKGGPDGKGRSEGKGPRPEGKGPRPPKPEESGDKPSSKDGTGVMSAPGPLAKPLATASVEDGESEKVMVNTAATDTDSPKKNKDGKKKEFKGIRKLPTFLDMDKDGDGKLSGSEIPEPMQRFVSRIDSDGDGNVSQAEFEGALNRMLEAKARQKDGDKKATASSESAKTSESNPAPIVSSKEDKKAAKSLRGGPSFDRLDKDQNGSLSGDEIPAAMQRFMDRIDTDSDGSVSATEFERVVERMKQRRNEQPDSSSPAATSPRDQFNNADANADGRLSAAEATGHLKANFDKFDTNADGQLSIREVEDNWQTVFPAPTASSN